MLRYIEVPLLSLTDRLDVVYYLIRDEVLRELGTLPATPLHELCSRVRTKTPPREAYVSGGIPCIKLRNVTGQMLNLANCAHIPERLRDKYVAARKNDIILTATGEGTAGRADIFTEPGTYIVTGENILLRPKTEKVNPFYLLAMLRANLVAKQLTHFVRGATGQTHLYWQDIADVKIPNADEKIQEACENLYKEADDLRKQSDQRIKRLRERGESVFKKS